MALKHNVERWKLRKYAERVLFRADFAVFWAQKEVIEPTTWVQHPADSDQRCLFIIYIGFHANAPLT